MHISDLHWTIVLDWTLKFALSVIDHACNLQYMGRDTTELRQHVEKHFTWSQKDGCYSCHVCSTLWKSIKKNNMLSKGLEHLKRQHQDEYLKLPTNVTAKQSRIGIQGLLVDGNKRRRMQLSASIGKTSLKMSVSVSARNNFYKQLLITPKILITRLWRLTSPKLLH